jgi:hypothetical protein
MFRSLIAALAAKLRGVLQPGWPPRARTLDQERKGHFFSWSIANPAAAGVPVLIRASAVPPAPGEDTTGGYLVYLGRRNHGRGHPREFKADDHEPAGILPGSADLRRRRRAAA